MMSRFLKVLRIIYFDIASTSATRDTKLGRNIYNNFLQCRTISCTIKCRTDIETEDAETKKKKKTPRIPKITLILPDNSITIMEIEEAEKLAKRRNLQLVNVTDLESKTERAVYKIVSTKDLIEQKIGEEDTIKSNGSDSTLKNTKLFYVDSKITDHDLHIKINKVNKLLSKNHKVKIVISHGDKNWESIVKTLEKQIAGSIENTTSRSKSTLLLFQPSVDKNVLNHENSSSKKIKLSET